MGFFVCVVVYFLFCFVWEGGGAMQRFNLFIIFLFFKVIKFQSFCYGI